ncbi:MAG: hypothetical protein IIX39_03360 [Clostridia bacterium]|nr:hypothetical protein [Clostridia bacterium]
MKKSIIKITSVILVLSTIFTLLFSVNAFATKEKNPTVFIDGICSSNIVKYNDDGTYYSIFPPVMDTIINAFKNMPGYFVDAIKENKTADEAFGYSLVNGCKEVFADIGCDKNGKFNEKTGITYDNLEPNYKETHRSYYFSFDWRLSVLEIAGQLNKYIKNVKEVTGCDKVNIIAFSMGGAVFTSYLYLFGHDDVDSAILYCSGALGSSVCGLPMSGDIDLRAEYLVGYLDGFIPEFNFKDFIINIAKVLHKIYALDVTVEALEDFLMNYEDELFLEVLFPSLGSCPGIWALCPEQYYDEAKEFVFGGREEQYKTLIELNDRYHNEVQPKAKSLYDKIIENGGNFAVVSKYNCYLTPVIEKCNSQSDGVIDTKFTSYGAVCADLNTSLGEDYIQKKYPEKNYISPDKVIDASTCWYPENTWFIRDMAHAAGCKDLYDFFDYIFESESQVTISDSSEYTQFMRFDKDTLSIVPLTDNQTPVYEMGSWFDIAFSFVSCIIKLLVSIIK